MNVLFLVRSDGLRGTFNAVENGLLGAFEGCVKLERQAELESF